jgi:hypothetical protein
MSPGGARSAPMGASKKSMSPWLRAHDTAGKVSRRILRAQSHLVTVRPQPSTTTPKHYCHLKVIAGNDPIAKTAEQMAQLVAVNAASSTSMLSTHRPCCLRR